MRNDRLEKSSGKIYWYGAGTEILDESDLSGNFTNEYVFFGGRRIAIRSVSSGTIDYYEEDVLGSSRTLVQAGGTSPCFDADFLPFGYEKDVTTTCSQNYKFEGKERDTETGDDDFGARYYTFRLGRWLSADWSSVPAPVPYANLTNPQTLNLYAMVSDNPESFVDLTGHGCEITAPGGITCTNVMAINRPNITGEDQNKASQKTGTGTGQSTTQKAQGAGQNSGNLTFDLGGVAVKFTWDVIQSEGGVDITATPAGCDSCEWAQTVSGTGVAGGTKADIQKDSYGNEADPHKYPFVAPNENPGQLFDSPARSAGPAKVSLVSTMGTSDGKTFHPNGSLVWGFSESKSGHVRFEGVRQSTAAEQKQSLKIWSAKTGMAVGP